MRWFLVSCMLLVPAFLAAQKEQINLETAIWRIHSEEVQVVVGGKERSPEESASFFHKGEIEAGDLRIDLGSENARLLLENGTVRMEKDENSRRSVLKDSQGKLLAESIEAPRITVLAGEAATFELESQPVHYLEQLEDGSFELREADEETGVSIDIEFSEEQSEDEIGIDHIRVETVSVSERKNLPGTTLNAGEPTIRRETTQLGMRRPGKDKPEITMDAGEHRWVAVRAHDGKGVLLISLKAELVR